MKRSISNLQTIGRGAGPSSALLFGVVLSLHGYHTQIADAKKSHQHNGSNSKDTKPDNTPDTAISLFCILLKFFNPTRGQSTEIINVV